MTTFAQLLRNVAEWLDPQPVVFELMRTETPVEADLNDLHGFPVYFWKSGERSISFYPIPDGEWRFFVRRGER